MGPSNGTDAWRGHLTGMPRIGHTYGLDEMAGALGVDRHTVWRWVDEHADSTGKWSHIDVGGHAVPAFRVGRSWRVAGPPLDRVLSGEPPSMALPS